MIALARRSLSRTHQHRRSAARARHRFGPGPARYIDDRHIYFTSSMPVVSTFIQSNGIGGLRSWSYGYGEAMYNQMGRGMQGFRTLIAEDDRNTGSRLVLPHLRHEAFYHANGVVRD